MSTALLTDLRTITNQGQLLSIDWQNFPDRPISREEFVHLGSLVGASWLHDGNPLHPHVELTTGLCSNGYFDILRLLRFTPVCFLLARQLVRDLTKTYPGRVDWVVGSDHAGATFSFAVATLFGAQHDFTERRFADDGKEIQIWKRFAIDSSEVVLQVEELMSTASTMQKVRTGVREGNAVPVTFAPVVATLVHRSDVTEIEGTPVVFSYHFDIWKALPKDCQLCQAGSERLRPKREWAKLTGKKQ